MNEIQQGKERQNNFYDLSPYLRARLWDNPDESDYFHRDEEKYEEFGEVVREMFLKVRITTRDSREQALDKINAYLKGVNIKEKDKNLILSLVDGGLVIAQKAIGLKLQLLDSLHSDLADLNEELKESKDDLENSQDIKADIQGVQADLDDLEGNDILMLVKHLRKRDMLNENDREATDTERSLIKNTVSNKPEELITHTQAKLALVLDLRPEEVIKALKESQEQAA